MRVFDIKTDQLFWSVEISESHIPYWNNEFFEFIAVHVTNIYVFVIFHLDPLYNIYSFAHHYYIVGSFRWRARALTQPQPELVVRAAPCASPHLTWRTWRSLFVDLPHIKGGAIAR